MNLTGYDRINPNDDGGYEMENKEEILLQWDSGFALNLDGTRNGIPHQNEAQV
jgi:hypothetical protein